MAITCECKPLEGTGMTNGCKITVHRILIYHPSNSKKGIPIKGTNLRIELIDKWIS